MSVKPILFSAEADDKQELRAKECQRAYYEANKDAIKERRKRKNK